MVYNIWKLSYWFNLRPEPLTMRSLLILTVAALIFAVAYFFCFKLDQRPNLGSYRKLIARLKVFSLTNSIIALMLAFFSWEMIPTMAARFWLILWWLMLITWGTFLAIDYKNLLKRIDQADRSKFIKDQYIPKKS